MNACHLVIRFADISRSAIVVLLLVLAWYALPRGGFAAQTVTGRDWCEAVPSVFSPRSGPGALVFNNKLWILGGDDGRYRGDVWASGDGTQWTRTAGDVFSPRHEVDSVMFNGRIWVFGGYDYNMSQTYRVYSSQAWSTADGVNWTTAPLTSLTPVAHAPFLRSGQGVVEFNGALWTVGGNWTPASPMTIDYNDIWRSDNGTEWERVVEYAAFAPRQGHATVIFNNKLWVIGGHSENNGAKDFNDVWSSADGVHWTSATLAAQFSPRSDLACASFGGKLWVIGGRDQHGATNNEIWNSADGIQWSRVTPDHAFQAASGYALAVRDGQLWLFGGPVDEYYHSMDGNHWIKETINHPGSRYGAIFLAHGGRLWVVNGQDRHGQTRHEIWSTPDGTSWTLAVSGANCPTGGASGLSFGGKMWLLGRQVWSSSDGTTWTTVTLKNSIMLPLDGKSLALDGKMWVVNDGKVWSSPDGGDWTETTGTQTYTSREAAAVVGYNHRLWLSGGGIVTWYRGLPLCTPLNDVWSSDEGSTWSQVNSNAGFRGRVNHSMADFDGRMWIIAGGSHTSSALSSNLDDVWWSQDGLQWVPASYHAAFPARSESGCAVLSGKLWIFGGISENGRLGDLWYTPGGFPSAASGVWMDYR